METRVVAGNVAQIQPDAVMVNLSEGVERPDRAAVDKVLNGGAIATAPFLGGFVDDTPWLHLDMAGPRPSTRESGDLVKGAAGSGVRTFVGLSLSKTENREAT